MSYWIATTAENRHQQPNFFCIFSTNYNNSGQLILFQKPRENFKTKIRLSSNLIIKMRLIWRAQTFLTKRSTPLLERFRDFFVQSLFLFSIVFFHQLCVSHISYQLFQRASLHMDVNLVIFKFLRIILFSLTKCRVWSYSKYK